MIQRMFVTLDTKKTNYKNVGKINHGDDLILELTVLSDGNMITFNDPMVDLLVKKSDGKMIRQNSGIEHIKPNKFVIEVSKDCVTSPGLSTNQLIINDNGRISTCMFYYTILNSLEEDIIESISSVEVLEQLDEYVIEARERIELLNNDINEMKSLLEDARGFDERIGVIEDEIEEINSSLDTLESEVNELKEGNINIDLTNYATKTELSLKVDKVNGKSLISDSEIERLSTLKNYDDTDIKNTLNSKANKTELHSHTNKTVLDGISSAKVTEWNNKSTFSGNYNDLTNKPTIPTLNGYATEQYVNEEIKKIDVTEQLTDYAKKSELHSHSNKSVLDDITTSKINEWDNKSNFSCNYNDLTNKPTIPTKVSELTNDEGYLTEYQTLKTINGESLVGSGDIVIEEGGGIDQELVDAINVQIENQEFISDDTEVIQLSDKEGNIIAEIKNDGTIRIHTLEVINLKSDNASTKGWLKGKNAFVLGDSLSTDNSKTGGWQSKFTEYTGAIMDNDLNRNWFSIGGTATIGTHDDSRADCQMRAKRLVEYYNGTYDGETHPVDVIFIQNVNDINNNTYSAGIHNKGTKDDLPFFENQIITCPNVVTVTSNAKEECLTYFKNNITTILEDVTPMVGTVVDILYTREGTAASKKLKISSGATKSGTITVKLKKYSNYSYDTFGVDVNDGMSVADVMNMILEWTFSQKFSYDDIKVSDNEILFSSDGGIYELLLDVGDTGIIYEVSDASTVTRLPIAFKSLNVDNFTNADEWVAEPSITYWSAQKGLVEYLQKNIPTARIFYLILPYTQLKYDNMDTKYLREDGSFKMEDWLSAGTHSSSAKNLYETQPLIAEYYGLGVVDLYKEPMCSPINMAQYFSSNNVHPTQKGYDLWGEIISRKIN